MEKNIVRIRSYYFAIAVLDLCKDIRYTHKEFIITKQLIRCGTSPGAMIREAEYAESKRDFIHKMSIALKETNETAYWLELLRDTGLISATNYKTIETKCNELLRLLTAIVKSAKSSL